MKKSRYNYILSYKGNEYLLFNTMNSSLVLLDAASYEKYIHFEELPENDEIIAQFYKQGIVVDDGLDEKAIIDFDRGRIAYELNNYIFRILPTTACNARCFYCYEKGASISSMDLDTANAVINYIRRKTKFISKFRINWFGGEPLLNSAIIDYISDALQLYSSETGVVWNTSMVSNGSLFTDELIEKAKTKWRLQNIQITLDGLKSQYEKVKSYIDGNTFESVVSNIQKLIVAGFNVSIRINYSANDLFEVEELIKYLYSELDVKYKNWRIYTSPIFNESKGEIDAYTVNMAQHFESMIHSLSNSPDRRLPRLPQYVHGRCRACSLSAETILPNGDLLKCCRFISKDDAFGSVRDHRQTLSSKYVKWCTVTLPVKCDSCVFLPICQGGCRAEQFLGNSGCPVKVRNIDLTLRSYADAIKNNSNK